MRRTLHEHQEAVLAVLSAGLGNPGPAGGRGTPPEWLPLDAALGRVSAADVPAAVGLPPFDNSQMDGFALAAGASAPGQPLLVADPVPAGSVAPPWQPGTAVPVMTGSMIPAGADAVVPVEMAQPPVFPDSEGGPVNVVLPEVAAGQFIRRAGSDLRAGEPAVRAGQLLTPAALGLLSATGAAEVAVRPQLRVLLLSTGDEVVAAGRPLAAGQIHDANSVMLAALLRQCGAQVRTAELVPDRPEHFLRLLAHELADPVDLVLTTGGISAGAYEVVKQALTGQGVDFVSVAMQPGGPQACGTVLGVPFLGFPGNPVSCAVSFEAFLRPALSALTGSAPGVRTTAALTAALVSPAGKVQFRRGWYSAATGGAGTVGPVGGPSSHLLSALAASNALICIPAETLELPAGSQVEVWML